MVRRRLFEVRSGRSSECVSWEAIRVGRLWRLWLRREGKAFVIGIGARFLIVVLSVIVVVFLFVRDRWGFSCAVRQTGIGVVQIASTMGIMVRVNCGANGKMVLLKLDWTCS